jgi:hypothetical protein
MTQRAQDIMRQRAASTTHPRRWHRTSGHVVPSGADRLLVVEARAHVGRENRKARVWSSLRRWLTGRG